MLPSLLNNGIFALKMMNDGPLVTKDVHNLGSLQLCKYKKHATYDHKFPYRLVNFRQRLRKQAAMGAFYYLLGPPASISVSISFNMRKFVRKTRNIH